MTVDASQRTGPEWKWPDLTAVSTTTLGQIHEAVQFGYLSAPVDRAALVAFGVRHQLDELTHALSGHKQRACLAILEAVLNEREHRRPPPELVWTGPEGPASRARDTAVVLRELFEGARENVVLAGYSFDHARDVLAPLHRVMRDHGVEARFFVDVPQVQRSESEAEYLARHLGGFLSANWPFGEPVPKIYYDKRALKPGPPFCSLHAKCVVVDRKKAFISSANFTQRGQERNIEVGVLSHDETLAESLADQWIGLVNRGVVGEFK